MYGTTLSAQAYPIMYAKFEGDLFLPFIINIFWIISHTCTISPQGGLWPTTWKQYLAGQISMDDPLNYLTKLLKTSKPTSVSSSGGQLGCVLQGYVQVG